MFNADIPFRPGEEQGQTLGDSGGIDPAYFSISIKEELYAFSEGFQERKKHRR